MRAIEVHGLPQSVEIERLVLGALQVDPDAQDVILSALDPEDFSREDHRRVFIAAMEVRAAGDTIDRVTLAHKLMDKGQLESVGGLTYLAEMDSDLPKLYGLDSYLKTLREKSILRGAVLAMHASCERLCGAGAGIPEMREAEEFLRSLSAKAESSVSLMTLAEYLEKPGAIDRIMHPEKAAASIVATPWGRLNEILSGGFRPGQLIILAARPGIGKSAVAAAISLHAATGDTGVALFSLEMGRDEIFQRMVASKAQISLSRLMRGDLSGQQNREVWRAMGEISETPLRVDDTSGASVPAIVGSVRKHNARLQRPIGLVVIDYLQLMGSAAKRQNRTEVVSEITRSLKLAARELRVPFLVLSQLSRDSAKDDREPELHDLRESGSIEQDADVVMFPHQTRKEQTEAFDQRRPGLMRMLVKKQRNGRLGAVNLLFHGKYMRIFEKEGDDGRLAED